MKNKRILMISLLVGLVALVTGKVLAENSIPKVISEACESRSGFLLARNKNGGCRKNAIEVVLGGEGQIGTSDIAFLMESSVLKKNGEVWSYSEMDGGWMQDFEMTITETVVDDIVQWEVTTFLTKDGHLWILDDDGNWDDKGVPGEIESL